MRISVIVPALNEARTIVATLASLQRERDAGHEVIVVDGGSTDATTALATPYADRVVVAATGRAAQMNAGAAVATGKVLLFLHADSRLPLDGIAAIAHALRASPDRWGRFDVSISGAASMMKVVAAMMNVRSRLTGISTGDQGIFVGRTLFDAVGGFPRQPLMEDIEICRRLKRTAGRPLCLHQRIATSGRRWERHGIWRTIFAMWRWRIAYWRGVDPAHIAGRYQNAATTQSPVTLQIFAKRPVPGEVKTRLARAIGDEGAAALYARFVERTLATGIAARSAGVVDRVELWCAPDAGAPEFAAWRKRYDVILKTQTGDDLGARMRNALYSAVDSGALALLIGTDCPALDVPYLARAIAGLDAHDAVYGPAEDGGYVLVGLARAIDVFTGIAWSTPDVMALTRLRLVAERASWTELPPLWDVDEAADLPRWDALQLTLRES